MKRVIPFLNSIRANIVAFLLFLAVWAFASLWFPAYVVPSPAAVFRNVGAYLNADFARHLGATVARVALGFLIAATLGIPTAIAAALLRKSAYLTTLMSLFEVLPGMIVGIIFLLMFGIGDGVPVALVAFLTLPAIAINTSGAIAKKSQLLEDYLHSIGGTRRHVIRYIYLPLLAPALQSNLTMGVSLALKVVVLGEFIGSQNGIGYLLNVAKIYFNMPAVFFYLTVILLIMLLFQIAEQLLFALVFGKYFYPE